VSVGAADEASGKPNKAQSLEETLRVARNMELHIAGMVEDGTMKLCEIKGAYYDGMWAYSQVVQGKMTYVDAVNRASKYNPTIKNEAR